MKAVGIVKQLSAKELLRMNAPSSICYTQS